MKNKTSKKIIAAAIVGLVLLSAGLGVIISSNADKTTESVTGTVTEIGMYYGFTEGSRIKEGVTVEYLYNGKRYDKTYFVDFDTGFYGEGDEVRIVVDKADPSNSELHADTYGDESLWVIPVIGFGLITTVIALCAKSVFDDKSSSTDEDEPAAVEEKEESSRYFKEYRNEDDYEYDMYEHMADMDDEKRSDEPYILLTEDDYEVYPADDGFFRYSTEDKGYDYAGADRKRNGFFD